jgi:hypothetical protein
MLNPQKMNTLPPKPNLVIKGEMPADIAAKMGLEVKDFDPSVRYALRGNTSVQHLSQLASRAGQGRA